MNNSSWSGFECTAAGRSINQPYDGTLEETCHTDQTQYVVHAYVDNMGGIRACRPVHFTLIILLGKGTLIDRIDCDGGGASSPGVWAAGMGRGPGQGPDTRAVKGRQGLGF